MLLLLLQVKNVAYSLKYTWYPILKALVFKDINSTFPFSPKQKVAEHRLTFVLLEVYRNIVTWPKWIAERTQFSGVKETWILTQVRWFFWDTSLPSSRSAGLPNKVMIPHPNILSTNLLASYVASSTTLGSGTKARGRAIHNKHGHGGRDREGRGSLSHALTVFGGNCQHGGVWGVPVGLGDRVEGYLVFPSCLILLEFWILWYITFL